jgi:hypothetical protein
VPNDPTPGDGARSNEKAPANRAGAKVLPVSDVHWRFGIPKGNSLLKAIMSKNIRKERKGTNAKFKRAHWDLGGMERGRYQFEGTALLPLDPAKRGQPEIQKGPVHW